MNEKCENKEFDKWFSELVLRYPIASGKKLLIELTKLAWYHQQKIIEQKDEEIERLKKDNEAHLDALRYQGSHRVEDIRTIERLKKDNEKYKKALGFYANEMSYSTDDYRGISGEMITRCVLYSDCEERNGVYSYAGRRARKALSEVENEI